MLHYSSYLGGTDTDNAYGIAVDTSNPASAYVAGQTCSTNFPVSNPEQVAPGGDCDAFVSKISILDGIQLNPSSLVFAAQSLNTTSAPETVTLTNGDNTLTSLTISSLGGANPGDFSESSTCAPPLTRGGKCAITVTFTPTAIGVRTATITVTYSAPGSPQVINITGTTSTLTLSAVEPQLWSRASGYNFGASNADRDQRGYDRANILEHHRKRRLCRNRQLHESTGAAHD